MLLFPQGGERVLTRLVVLTVLRQKMRMGTGMWGRKLTDEIADGREMNS